MYVWNPPPTFLQLCQQLYNYIPAIIMVVQDPKSLKQPTMYDIIRITESCHVEKYTTLVNYTLDRLYTNSIVDIQPWSSLVTDNDTDRMICHGKDVDAITYIFTSSLTKPGIHKHNTNNNEGTAISGESPESYLNLTPIGWTQEIHSKVAASVSHLDPDILKQEE